MSLSLKDDHTINISGDDVGIAIGRYGETLMALERLVNLMLNRSAGVNFRVRLDSNGYRDRREESIRRIAASAAKKLLTKTSL
ncbi:KH domain-containing protein [Acetomicrobium sp.]|uniref:KH domain-containing protein n=1 Tax=Acetomicrobium sp. TaxID=1872099 RepID=UPI002870BF21|nr:KH domain-containing protein [Acetomicrobium sp.]MDR9770979.1 KH domain-containing protein [Acetomicrobium sp.]